MTAPLVLIADNDRAVNSLLVEVLQRKGLRTTCAYDGESASELAHTIAELDQLLQDLATRGQVPFAVPVGAAATALGVLIDAAGAHPLFGGLAAWPLAETASAWVRASISAWAVASLSVST